MVRFSAVGDIMFGDHPLCVGFGTYSNFKGKSPDYPFNHIRSELSKADILFGNLESILSNKGLKVNNYKSIQMRGSPEQINGLANAGFKVLSLANNHSLQHGEEPFLDTLSLLKKNGIEYCGVNLENPLIGKPVVITGKDIKVAFLGYSLRPRQYFSDVPLYTEGRMRVIESDIAKIRKSVDFVFISLHWGEEFIENPSPEERKIARSIIDSGADLIIGHHPHVLRGIENYEHGVIVYSLGNFISDMVWDGPLRESLIFNCDLTKQGIKNIQLVPVYINNSYQPEIMEGREGNILLSKINRLSETLHNDNFISDENKNLEYQKDANEMLRLNRNKSQRYFVLNLYRYPFVILIQQLNTYLRNQLSRFYKKILTT
jgi:poly-gamma-glutamate synthesis protein (capsule biosynthesis protein)